jgi:hypothetical protein
MPLFSELSRHWICSGKKPRTPFIQTGEMNGSQRSGEKNAVADSKLTKSPAVFTSGAFYCVSG